MELTIPVGDASTAALIEGEGDDLFILAHGAGTGRDGATILELRDVLVGIGLRVARFNFLYKELGRGGPDRMPVLMQTYRAVADRLRSESPGRLVCGGHSMGGRTASMIASEGYAMDALVPMAYPLHPAGQPSKLRDAHLPSIEVPTLCLNGTRDELCTRELMEAVLKKVQPSFRMHWLEGADHSYKVPKSSGRTRTEVLGEIGDAVRDFLAEVPEVGA